MYVDGHGTGPSGGGSFYRSLAEKAKEYAERRASTSRANSSPTPAPDPPAIPPTKIRGSKTAVQIDLTDPLAEPADDIGPIGRSRTTTPLPTKKSAGPTAQIGGLTADPNSSRKKATANADEMSRKAILSVNRINLTNPPLKLHFGTFNPRPVVDSGVKELIKAFEDDFTPFKMESMIPILINRNDVDPSCINLDFTLGHDAPQLLLSKKGQTRDSLTALGGRHRYEAVRKMQENIDKKIKGLELRINKLKGKAKGAKKVKAEKSVEELDGNNDFIDIDPVNIDTEKKSIEELNDNIDMLQADKVYYSSWGVILYDAGMCF